MHTEEYLKAGYGSLTVCTTYVYYTLPLETGGSLWSQAACGVRQLPVVPGSLWSQAACGLRELPIMPGSLWSQGAPYRA